MRIGTANDNQMLDTRVYDVEYADGYIASMSANEVAVNIFSQVDGKGNRLVLLYSLVDYRTNSNAITQKDAFVSTKSAPGRQTPQG